MIAIDPYIDEYWVEVDHVMGGVCDDVVTRTGYTSRQHVVARADVSTCNCDPARHVLYETCDNEHVSMMCEGVSIGVHILRSIVMLSRNVLLG